MSIDAYSYQLYYSLSRQGGFERTHPFDIDLNKMPSWRHSTAKGLFAPAIIEYNLDDIDFGGPAPDSVVPFYGSPASHIYRRRINVFALPQTPFLEPNGQVSSVADRISRVTEYNSETSSLSSSDDRSECSSIAESKSNDHEVDSIAPSSPMIERSELTSIIEDDESIIVEDFSVEDEDTNSVGDLIQSHLILHDNPSPLIEVTAPITITTDPEQPIIIDEESVEVVNIDDDDANSVGDSVQINPTTSPLTEVTAPDSITTNAEQPIITNDESIEVIQPSQLESTMIESLEVEIKDIETDTETTLSTSNSSDIEDDGETESMTSLESSIVLNSVNEVSSFPEKASKQEKKNLLGREMDSTDLVLAIIILPVIYPLTYTAVGAIKLAECASKLKKRFLW